MYILLFLYFLFENEKRNVGIALRNGSDHAMGVPDTIVFKDSFAAASGAFFFLYLLWRPEINSTNSNNVYITFEGGEG